MLNTPFSPWPVFSAEEIEAVRAVLASGRVNYWTGKETRQFESEFAASTGSPFAVALTNGTLALDLALRALGIGAGDEVVVTPRTFLASASCAVLVGATPVFADVDADSQNMTAATIEAVLTPRTRAIICVHLGGMPCEMDAIMDLAERRGLKVIEDCAQANGAMFLGRSVGTFGEIGAWSFCQDKIITTGGEGGMVTTGDRDLWSAMWSFKDHGKSWEAVNRPAVPGDGGYRWMHESFGSNYRMLEMQAAIGRLQLRRLPEWSARRAANAQRILDTCRECEVLRVPDVSPHATPAWYRAYAFVRPDRLAAGWTRDRVINEVLAAGVPCYSGTCSEVYLEKAFDGTDFRPSSRLPVARQLGETSVMFLVHPTLTDAEIGRTCEAVRSVAARALR